MYGSKNSIMIDNHAHRPGFFPSKVHNDLMPQIKKSFEKLPDSIPPTHIETDIDISVKYHYNNWLLACRGEGTCNSNFGFGVRLTETMLFGIIATHLNCNLDIDPVKRTIIGNEKALEIMDTAPRECWKI